MPLTGIYDFEGRLEILEGDKIGVGLEQTLWRGVKLAAGKVVLLVIYTGR
jgi:hypothetical protein